MAGVGEVGSVGHSAGKRAGLRLEHRLACGVEGGLKFRSKTAVDLGNGSLLPATVVWLVVLSAWICPKHLTESIFSFDWIIPRLRWKKEGCVKSDRDASNCFPINPGMRQGCVLNLKLISSVQQWETIVGRTGDMFGRSRVTIECAKIKGPDNSITKSDRGASSKWTGH